MRIKKLGIVLFITFFSLCLHGLVLGQVRINEIRGDDNSTDDIEFIELIGVVGTDITNYQIKHVNGNDDATIFTYTITSFTIPNDGITDDQSNNLGFFVLGIDTTLINPDQIIPTSLQNGPDGIILYNASGDVIDAVAWQGAGNISTDITTSGSPTADNYLHVTQDDDSGDNSLQAPNDVVGDNGSGWTLAIATPGAINDGQNSGSIVLTSSIKGQPANHVSSFSATGAINSVDLSWTDALGSPVPDAYLIKVSDVGYGSITNPTDTNAESNDTDLSDGSGISNVAQGIESASFSGLDETTTYYFKIYPYTNTGSDIDYKTDGTIPQDDATTLETPDIVLNEILADPASGADPNGDGSPDTGDDEFLEFVNTGTTDLEISDWTIEDAGGTTHTFTNPTVLKPLQAIVVFGGGTPTGNFGGALTQTSSGLSLNNGGDDVILKNDSGIEIINYTYSGATDQSKTRNPDLTGGFADHETSDTEDGSSYSPGTRIDGSTFQPTVTIDGNAGWRMLSFPVTAGTVEDINDDTAIQGISGGDNETADKTFYFYDDSGSWDWPTNVSTTFGDGYGFITYFFDTNVTGTELPNTLEVFGTEPAADVVVDLNTSTQVSSAYFTLVGNPFHSNYDLSSITVSGSGTIQNNVHFWDNSTDSYVEQDRTTPFITATWQGFWVESADGATEITIPTSGKTSSASTATYFSKQTDQITKADVQFELSSESTLDKAIRLSFRKDAVLGWDLDDATKLVPLSPIYATIAFVGEDKLQSVYSLPTDLNGTEEVLLEEQAYGVSGEVTLSWSGIVSVPQDITLTLKDYETGESIDMRLFDSYTFVIEDTTSGKYQSKTVFNKPQLQVQRAKGVNGPKLGIVISRGEATSNESDQLYPDELNLYQNYPNPFNPTTSIKFEVPETAHVSLTVYNVMGQRVSTLVNESKSAGTHQLSWEATSMASGIYYYRLKAGETVLTRQMTLIK